MVEILEIPRVALIAASAEGRLPGAVTIEEYTRGASRYTSQGDADLQRAEDATVNLLDSMDFATVIAAPATAATVSVAGQLHETAALLATEALTDADDDSVQHQELSREDTERASLSSAVSPDEAEPTDRSNPWRRGGARPPRLGMRPCGDCQHHPVPRAGDRGPVPSSP